MLVIATNCYSSNDQFDPWASNLKRNHITGMQLNKKDFEIKVKLFKLSFNVLIYVLLYIQAICMVVRDRLSQEGLKRFSTESQVSLRLRNIHWKVGNVHCSRFSSITVKTFEGDFRLYGIHLRKAL